MENHIFELQYAIDTFYFLVMGALVMWMAAGFSMLEAGLVRAKNFSRCDSENQRIPNLPSRSSDCYSNRSFHRFTPFQFCLNADSGRQKGRPKDNPETDLATYKDHPPLPITEAWILKHAPDVICCAELRRLSACLSMEQCRTLRPSFSANVVHSGTPIVSK